MALPVTIPNEFANATASIPLSQLDANFNTLANAVNGISDGSESLANVSVTGGTISNVAVSATTLNTSGAVVFNDAGADVDFRVEGDTDANLLFVDASADKVGVGTSTPSGKMQIVGGTSASTSYDTLVLLGGTSGTVGSGAKLYLSGANTAPTIRCAYIEGVSTGGGNAHDLVFATSASSASPSERMRITSGGEVYIAGTTDRGAYNLQCNGTGVWGQGAYVNGSDERMKQNIADLQDGLSVVTQLRPVTYQYREEFSRDQNTQPGFIAQELQAVLDGKDYKDGVVPEGPEYLNVAYQNLIPILTKAIQELKAELDTVKAELATLKG